MAGLLGPASTPPTPPGPPHPLPICLNLSLNPFSVPPPCHPLPPPSSLPHGGTQLRRGRARAQRLVGQREQCVRLTGHQRGPLHLGPPRLPARLRGRWAGDPGAWCACWGRACLLCMCSFGPVLVCWLPAAEVAAGLEAQPCGAPLVLTFWSMALPPDQATMATWTSRASPPPSPRPPPPRTVSPWGPR